MKLFLLLENPREKHCITFLINWILSQVDTWTEPHYVRVTLFTIELSTILGKPQNMFSVSVPTATKR